MADVPEVLFVCVHNAGRSQMAAALLDWRAEGRVRVRSAGSAPADEINPAVITAMEELGLDLSKEFPKPLTGEFVRDADIVITMGCGDACPFYPGKRYLDWDLEDPAGKSVDEVRRIRDEIDRRVQELVVEVVGAPIACTLESAAIPERLAQWQEVLHRARARTTAADGALRVEFGDDLDVGELARIVVAEHRCCPFLSFTLTIDARGTGLEIRAPEDAAEVVLALFDRG